jgi:hypothetical protein
MITIYYRWNKTKIVITLYSAKTINLRWYKNGLLHREDGPAIAYFREGELGEVIWFKQGKRHNTKQPNIFLLENGTSSITWYYENWLHREDGPASYYEKANGERCFEQYNLFDLKIEEETFKKAPVTACIVACVKYWGKVSKEIREWAKERGLKQTQVNKILKNIKSSRLIE